MDGCQHNIRHFTINAELCFKGLNQGEKVDKLQIYWPNKILINTDWRLLIKLKSHMSKEILRNYS